MRRSVFPLPVVLLAAALAFAGCRAEAPSGNASVYRLRGEVAQLPAGDHMITLHHEAIDDFRDREGRVAGMDSMTMPFPLAKEVSLAGVAVGDRVEATLRVDWAADPGVEITSLTELPAAAPPLVFREARPPGKAG